MAFTLDDGTEIYEWPWPPSGGTSVVPTSQGDMTAEDIEKIGATLGGDSNVVNDGLTAENGDWLNSPAGREAYNLGGTPVGFSDNWNQFWKGILPWDGEEWKPFGDSLPWRGILPNDGEPWSGNPISGIMSNPLMLIMLVSMLGKGRGIASMIPLMLMLPMMNSLGGKTSSPETNPPVTPLFPVEPPGNLFDGKIY